MGSVHATLPDEMIEELDEVVENDPVIQNRSEFIRRAVHEKLVDERDE